MKNKKVIFICGSGGSGKTTLSKTYFAEYEKVNVDDIYEKLLIENNLDLKIIDFNANDTKKSNELFEQSKKELDIKLIDFIKNEKNIIIDSVGRDADVILNLKYWLESFGYSTYMIMVYSDLNVCIERVNNRDRTYKKNITIDSWYAAYGNIVIYKKTFKNKFLLIQTDTGESMQDYIFKFLNNII
jgi:cytidylate kinase